MKALIALLLWCLLFAASWPLALAALFLWPLVRLASLPFRLVGLGVGAAFALLGAVSSLPARARGHRR